MWLKVGYQQDLITPCLRNHVLFAIMAQLQQVSHRRISLLQLHVALAIRQPLGSQLLILILLQQEHARLVTMEQLLPANRLSIFELQ